MTRRELLSASAAVPLLAGHDANARFAELANSYIQAYLEANPEFATALGEHRYDHRLSDVSAAGLAKQLERQREFLRKLKPINLSQLSGPNRVDCQILRNHLESATWAGSVLREHEWNPMRYNPGGAIYGLLERDFAPLPQRLKSAASRLQAVPEMLESAKKNLRDAPRTHVETAILQTAGTKNLFSGVLDSFVAKAPAMRDAVALPQGAALTALDDWVRWLKNDLLGRAKRDFRIGPELYRQKLRYALNSSLSPEEVRARAERDLLQTQTELYETAAQLYPKLLGKLSASGDRKVVIRAVLDKLAEQKPKAGTIVEQARRELVDATAFVRQSGLVSVYDTPLRIVEMPEFQRGVAVASCASPGPFERNGLTFFNISPPPANWTEQQVDSYFREYNDYMVRNLTVHEAMPGHYLQRSHANRFEAPTLTRAIFSSGTFNEGWAVYAERIMVESGYGGPEVKMQQLKMRLRTIINALIDGGVHARGMTEQQAMDLMMNDGFQERSEAAGKWRRASLTSAQLSTYYVGTTELDALREDYIRKHGPVRDWKAFHDRLLSYGSPAPRFLHELMGLNA